VEQALSCFHRLPDRQPIIEARLCAALAALSLNPPDARFAPSDIIAGDSAVDARDQ